MMTKIIVATGLLFLFCVAEVNADTVFLKNGRSINGFIKNEDNESIELDVGYGTVKFYRTQIERMYKATPEESEELKRKWAQDKAEQQKRLIQSEMQPKQVTVFKEGGHIVVEASLNGKVRASLFLDTGASLVVLSKRIAEQLGIDVSKSKNLVQLQVADGRIVNAALIRLESVRVQDVEAEHVNAAVLMQDILGASFNDGLLGMSFLSKFSFKVDYKNSKLILEKLH